MKKFNLTTTIIVLILSTGVFNSCELDNYDGPDSAIFGTIIDNETNSPIEQDIIDGSQIEYIEHGFDNPTIQYMWFKTDGTFRNNLMFSGTYTITPVRGNFLPIESEEYTINGETKVDFYVQPYIRIQDALIEKIDDKIIARFRIQQTVSDNILKIGLYAHQNPIASDRAYIVSSEKYIEDTIDPNSLQTLEIDIAANSSDLKNGKQYFFRIGALIDVPEAKSNYSTVVRIEI